MGRFSLDAEHDQRVQDDIAIKAAYQVMTAGKKFDIFLVGDISELTIDGEADLDVAYSFRKAADFYERRRASSPSPECVRIFKALDL